MTRVFGCTRDDVTICSRVLIIKHITAYYYAHKLKEVEVDDTGWTHKNVHPCTGTEALYRPYGP